VETGIAPPSSVASSNLNGANSQQLSCHSVLGKKKFKRHNLG
jgi:hypothetical protein